MKKAILAVSYGAARAEPLNNSVEATENAFRASFPLIPVFRAFTGKRIIDALRSRGIAVDSPEEALSKLAGSGFDEIRHRCWTKNSAKAAPDLSPVPAWGRHTFFGAVSCAR